MLRFFSDLSVADTAAALNCSPGNVTARDPNSCEHQLLTLPDDPAFKALGETAVTVAAADPTGRWAVGGTAVKSDADAARTSGSRPR